MHKKIVSLSLAVILAGTLAGCSVSKNVEEVPLSSTPSLNTSSTPSTSLAPTSASTPAKTPIAKMSVAENVQILGNRAAVLLSDAKFREAFNSFLETGKKPTGQDKSFESLSALVAKDKVFEAEKKIYLAEAKNNTEIITGGKDVDLYLSAVVVLNIMSPELLDSTEKPDYQFDEKLLEKKDGLLTWKQSGGLRVVDGNGVITAMGIPTNAQYLTADGALLSAKGIPTYLVNFNKSTFNAVAMNALLADVQSWIDKNSEKVEAETDISSFTEAIFANSEIEAGATISINGTVQDYVIDLVTDTGSSTITSSGETGFSRQTAGENFELAESNIAKAWSAYETVYLMNASDSKKVPTLELVVAGMEKSEAVKGAKWSVGKSKDETSHMVVEMDGQTYKFYDITAVAG